MMNYTDAMNLLAKDNRQNVPVKRCNEWEYDTSVSFI